MFATTSPGMMATLAEAFWPSLFPASWALTPWAATGVSVALLSLPADALLARRYAGGSGERDGGTCLLLVLSLSANLALAFALAALGIGKAPWAPELLAGAGLALAAGGLVLRYSAIFALGPWFTWRVTLAEGQALVTTGVFAFVRHPSYAGGLLSLVGLNLALGSSLSLLVLLVTHVPLVLHRIRVEEAALVDRFGESYRSYMARTARLVPVLY